MSDERDEALRIIREARVEILSWQPRYRAELDAGPTPERREWLLAQIVASVRFLVQTQEYAGGARG